MAMIRPSVTSRRTRSATLSRIVEHGARLAARQQGAVGRVRPIGEGLRDEVQSPARAHARSRALPGMPMTRDRRHPEIAWPAACTPSRNDRVSAASAAASCVQRTVRLHVGQPDPVLGARRRHGQHLIADERRRSTAHHAHRRARSARSPARSGYDGCAPTATPARAASADGRGQHVAAARVAARRDVGRRDDAEEAGIVTALLAHVGVEIHHERHDRSLGSGTDAAPRYRSRMPQNVMPVEVWSDVVCPWCCIGRAHLQAALAEFEHGDPST